jgi:hypothetical protein
MNFIKIEKTEKRDKSGRVIWLVECKKCSSIIEMNSHSIKESKSCVKCRYIWAVKHGKCDNSIYRIYSSMKERCYNVKSQRYKWYGERGIKVCNEWKKDFDVFYKWAINNGYEKGLSIDRIDNNRDYAPCNCRFTNNQIQGLNRNIFINNTSGYTGVVYRKKSKYNNALWIGRIKINNKYIAKTFSVKKYGKKKAKELAINAREELFLKYYNKSIDISINKKNISWE